MLILRDDLSAFQGSSVMTIGKFDGIHLAHQHLIATINQRAAAQGAVSAMVTFDPHPEAILNPQGAPPLLTPLPEKIALLEQAGLGALLLLTFNEQLMRTRAADFLDALAGALRPRELWVGEDFALGYRREGDVSFIRQWAHARTIEVFSIPTVEVGGERVSGSRIRGLLGEGQVEAAARLLGRPPSVQGVVQQGDQRGRTIGFPTANLLPAPRQALPADGVYATRAYLPDGRWCPSVSNVGTRPTFEGTQRRVECHLFEWEGDLYGQPLTVCFYHRLREERKFSGLPALLAQIEADAAQARRYLQTLEG